MNFLAEILNFLVEKVREIPEIFLGYIREISM
jgi:hypothetical protein